jgi:GPH family glycoside/pentoside/hexuronide:cation symporter
MYYTPHAGLVSLSTRNSKDRSLLATLSNATMLAAMGLAQMILPFFITLLFVPDANDSALCDSQASYAHWKVFVIALLVVTVIGTLIEYFFTRERITEETMGKETSAKPSLSTTEQWKICSRDKFWIIMMVFFFLYQFGGMIKNVSQNYFCTSMFADAQGNYTVAYGGQLQGTLSIIGAIPTAVGMVVALPLAKKIARRTMRIVHENIIFALAVKFGILFLSAAGLTNMWWAVFGDVGVLILATLNAMRCMLRVKE